MKKLSYLAKHQFASIQQNFILLCIFSCSVGPVPSENQGRYTTDRESYTFTMTTLPMRSLHFALITCLSF